MSGRGLARENAEIQGQEFDADLFDDSPVGGLFSFDLNDGLTDAQKLWAEEIARYSVGIMMITGPPRSGKDLFGNAFSFWIKHLFRGRHVLRDEKPRSPYGKYIPFTMDTLFEDIARMNEVGTGLVRDDIDEVGVKKDRVAHMADSWMSSRGAVLLQSSVLYIAEFWRWMNCRETSSRINRTMGAILKYWGHLDFLLLGNAQRASELDRQLCLPYVTHEVRCRWSTKRANTGLYNIYSGKFISSSGAWEVDAGEPWRVEIDGAEPQPVLGGLSWFDVFNTKSPPKLLVG